MFDFLFRRRKSAASQAAVVPAPTLPAVSAAASQRQRALDQAAALDTDEQAAVAFILGCNVAEARLQAAQRIRTRAALGQVQKAMRQTDRRVAKLMQQRLDVLTRQDLTQQKAQALIAQAQVLCAETALRANQVVDLEAAWQVLDAAPETQPAFASLREILNRRLQTQATLQRRVLDATASLRRLLADAASSADAVGQAAETADAILKQAQQDAELPSLPKQLVPELGRLRVQLQQLQDALAADQAAFLLREQALDGWQAQAVNATKGIPAEMPATSASVVTVLPVESSTVVAPVAATPELEAPELEAPELKTPEMATPEIVASEAAIPRAEIQEAEIQEAEIPGTGKEAAIKTSAAETQPAVLTATTSALPRDTRDTRETLQRAWRAMPALADVARMQLLQERFDSLLLQFAPAPAATVKAAVRPRPAPPVLDAVVAIDGGQQQLQFTVALESLQAALEEGALQQAMEKDRVLRGLNLDTVRLTADQQSTLATARAELARLQGWARWGGTVSREELLVAVEALPQQELAVAELAKKVGSMRERWRALDASAGAAPRALWLRFDAACTNAYAPVAAHFAVLAQERATNAAKAQGLLDEIAAFEVAAFVATTARDEPETAASAPDWHAITGFCQRTRQAWQRLGPLERKEQKRLDAAFAKAMLPLQASLAAQQAIEVGQRQLLIDEVARLAPQARDTPEQLQSLQLRWQHLAKSFPLARQEEQLLWQQFRAACDSIFAQRKTAGAAADAQRTASQQVKADLCQALEDAAAGSLSAAQHASLLRQSRAAWDAAGPVPRAVQAVSQSRFDAAVVGLEAHQKDTLRAALAEKYGAVQAKLQLCQQQEQQLVAALPCVPELDLQWTQLAALPDALEQALRARFDAATRALDAADGQYAALLLQNQLARDAVLLRLEVACTLDSPPAFQRERLALQVAGLQSTFKAGATGSLAGTDKSQLTALCAIPALADDLAQSRMKKVVAALVAVPDILAMRM